MVLLAVFTRLKLPRVPLSIEAFTDDQILLLIRVPNLVLVVPLFLLLAPRAVASAVPH